MGKRMQNKSAICPFYRGHEKQELYCEGLVEDSNIHQGYANPCLRKHHMETYCEGEYRNCPIEQMLEKKWYNSTEKR